MFGKAKLGDPLIEQKIEQKPNTTVTKQVTIPTRKFLEKTIELALDQFVCGIVNNTYFKKMLASDEKLCQSVRPSHIAGLSPLAPQFNDDAFPTYNANIIPDTNFIASAGPYTEEHVAEFFYNMIHLPVPVQEIIAFGDELLTNQSINGYADYRDYFTVPGSYKTADYEIQISCMVADGTLSTNAAGHHYSPTDKPVRSKLNVTYIPSATNTLRSKEKIEKEINVTFHSLIDNSFLDLATSSDQYNNIVCQHFEKAQHVPTLVHCAAGVGRTGQFIFMMELLKNYDQIFLNKTEMQSAAEILYILERIRKTRPGLVWTDEQFQMTIYNVIALRKYALKKGYSFDEFSPVLEATPTPSWQPKFRANLGDEEGLARIKDALIGDLINYQRFLELNPVSEKRCFFSCKSYPASDQIAAINFVLAILDGTIPTSGSIMQYQDIVRHGMLGKIIRKYAHNEPDLGTVRNLVLVAYNTAHKYSTQKNVPTVPCELLKKTA